MKALITERLILRPALLSELAYYCQMDTDPELLKYIGSGKVKTTAETKKWLAERVDQYDNGLGLWSVYQKSDKAFAGSYTIRYLDNTREIEIGYRFLKSCWGKGYGTESSLKVLDYGMNELGYDRIVAVTHPENEASMKVLRKIGMAYEKKAWYYQSEVNYFFIEKKSTRVKALSL